MEHYKYIKQIGKLTSSVGANVSPDLRSFIANLFGCGDYVSRLLGVTNALIPDLDKFRQRAGAELLTGLLRGVKHWAPQSSDQVWNWLSGRLSVIYAQIKPDTSTLWQCVFHVSTQVIFVLCGLLNPSPGTTHLS